MKVITRKMLARDAAKRWLKQYPFERAFPSGESSSAIHAALVALGPNPTPEQVDEVVDGGWAVVMCNECDSQVELIVQLGEAQDYDSKTAQVCILCLTAALAVATKALEVEP